VGKVMAISGFLKIVLQIFVQFLKDHQEEIKKWVWDLCLDIAKSVIKEKMKQKEYAKTSSTN
jgi:hypothetical protein